MKLQFQIQDNGSFSIYHRKTPLLLDCFPGINGRPIRILSVSSNQNTISYQTKQGNICFTFCQEAESQISILVHLFDFTIAIHDFSIFESALTSNLKGIYQAALGMGGNTGYRSIQTALSSTQDLRISYGLTSLKYHQVCLTAFAEEHKQYLNSYDFPICQGQLNVSARFDLENIPFKDITLPKVNLTLTKNMEEGLEHATTTIASHMNARTHQPAAYHWCSWYYYYHNFDFLQLQAFIKGLNHLTEKPPIRYIQIDAGYFPSCGDWLVENERWSGGLSCAFNHIQKSGYQAGIWVGIFMVGCRSKLYQEHPDWMLYHTDGTICREWITDNEPKPWGYQDEEYYILDTSHPEAMNYVRMVFRTLKSWGATMFKTDFMFWGLQDSSKVKRYTPGKTSLEYFRDTLDVIRQEIGEESYWLGCIAPFLPFVGYADAMRIGGDVGTTWKGDFGPQNMITTLVGNNYTNHIYYQNDSDAVLLRDFHIRLTHDEMMSLAMLTAISGSCIYASDPLYKLSAQRLQLFQYIQPDIRRKPFLPFLEEERPEIVMVHREESTHKGIVFLFNRTDETIITTYSLEQLGFTNDYCFLDFKDHTACPMVEQKLFVNIRPHSCKLFLATCNPNDTIDYQRIWNNLKA